MSSQACVHVWKMAVTRPIATMCCEASVSVVSQARPLPTAVTALGEGIHPGWGWGWGDRPGPVEAAASGNPPQLGAPLAQHSLALTIHLLTEQTEAQGPSRWGLCRRCYPTREGARPLREGGGLSGNVQCPAQSIQRSREVEGWVELLRLEK